ncbi:hypothetical protein RFI_29923 [Reticulomyxa filosa]|uniref:Uncharacterized protein n=1 Tax=Reticulomyxa filosa TaxID=46433 RepID=X6LZX6_RETFI|nr:hypothetical protein RFI_29923 [Reticulomyxa filosa]|eukprot:ETO07468.1 hypothetical protein RFI_29923 [Reticulomyxa filosa]
MLNPKKIALISSLRPRKHIGEQKSSNTVATTTTNEASPKTQAMHNERKGDEKKKLQNGNKAKKCANEEIHLSVSCESIDKSAREAKPKPYIHSRCGQTTDSSHHKLESYFGWEKRTSTAQNGEVASVLDVKTNKHKPSPSLSQLPCSLVRMETAKGEELHESAKEDSQKQKKERQEQQLQKKKKKKQNFK